MNYLIGSILDSKSLQAVKLCIKKNSMYMQEKSDLVVVTNIYKISQS